jgi:hypothetical protein
MLHKRPHTSVKKAACFKERKGVYMEAAEKTHRLLSPSPCLSLPDRHTRALATNGKVRYRTLRILRAFAHTPAKPELSSTAALDAM